MTRAIVQRLANFPCAFDFLRWVLEAGYRGHLRVIREELAIRTGRVLDCGCGTGIYAPCFSADDYIGVDISPKYVEAARRKYPGYRFDVMDATSLRFDCGEFDRCFVSGLLHHLDDETCRSVCRELGRVLKPGGVLVVWEDVPTPKAWNVLGRLVHRLDVGRHIRTADGYRRLLESTFRIERQWPMRSGCMDYAVFRCLGVANPPPSNQIREG